MLKQTPSLTQSVKHSPVSGDKAEQPQRRTQAKTAAVTEKLKNWRFPVDRQKYALAGSSISWLLTADNATSVTRPEPRTFA